MAKLGYTWYPKDWGNSEAVFELTLIERGLYRELIDMAMLNDNKTIINLKTWARKFGSSEDEIEGILITLSDLNLIKVDKETLFIPSCESRLNLVRGGRNGGKKSKPTTKPIEKPTPKPTPKQKKDKHKRETESEKEIEIPEYSEFISYAREHKPKVIEQEVKIKYEAWKVNGWKDGYDKPINNWKLKLLNSLKYFGESSQLDYVVDNSPVN